MKNALHISGWFVGLLAVALTLDYAFFWAQSFLILASLEWNSEAWSTFRRYGGIEAIYGLCCFLFFVSAGAFLAAKRGLFLPSAIFALLLGISFSLVVWLDGPRIYYSHAPLWLRALAWASLYVPTVAASLGTLLWWLVKGRHIREQYAA